MHLENFLKEFLCEEGVQKSLKDEETYETIDLSSSIALSSTPPTDPYWPSLLPSLYYTLYKLEPSMRSSYRANQSKLSQVEATSRNFSNHAKLEGILNQDPYVMLYDIYYGRQPLFDERFSKSQADDFKSSASWEATQAF